MLIFVVCCYLMIFFDILTVPNRMDCLHSLVAIPVWAHLPAPSNRLAVYLYLLVLLRLYRFTWRIGSSGLLGSWLDNSRANFGFLGKYSSQGGSSPSGALCGKDDRPAASEPLKEEKSCWDLFILFDSCWYVLIYVDICWYLFIFVVVYWYLFILFDILFIFVHICLYLFILFWYLFIVVDICWYLLLFVHICWYLFIFVEYLFIFVDIYEYLLIFVNICWYLFIFVHVWWYLLRFVICIYL